MVDTHAGAGLYRLDGDYAGTSGEAADGVLRLLAPSSRSRPAKRRAGSRCADAPSRATWRWSATSIPKGGARIYPGSPFITHHLLREHDKLKLFELHPTDARTLDANIAQLEAGRQIAVLRDDGFGSATKFLPPPSRRALVLCDPSYEIKSDYARVLDFVAEALKRFATGTYAVWYPIIPRPEAHDLPRRLKTLATKAGKPWLHATLTVKSSKIVTDATRRNAPAGPAGQRHVPDQSAVHAEAAARSRAAADGRAPRRRTATPPPRWTAAAEPAQRRRRAALTRTCAAATWRAGLRRRRRGCRRRRIERIASTAAPPQRAPCPCPRSTAPPA